jgi:hypothetical protein
VPQSFYVDEFAQDVVMSPYRGADAHWRTANHRVGRQNGPQPRPPASRQRPAACADAYDRTRARFAETITERPHAGEGGTRLREPPVARVPAHPVTGRHDSKELGSDRDRESWGGQQEDTPWGTRRTSDEE